MHIFRYLLLLIIAVTSSANAGELVTLDTREGVTQSFLLLTPENPVAAVVLFAGGGGVLRLADNGRIRTTKNNFLVRTRKYYHDAGFLVAVIDAPSDHQRGQGMRGGFRDTAEHAGDIAAVVGYVRKLNDVPIWLVGTSRGTESVANVAIRHPSLLDGIVLTASMSVENNSGVSLPEMQLDKVIASVLIVTHEDDQCWLTPPDDAGFIKDSLTNAKEVEIKTFRGGYPAESDDCKGRSAHGFFGIETTVTDAIIGFIRQRIL